MEQLGNEDGLLVVGTLDQGNGRAINLADSRYSSSWIWNPTFSKFYSSNTLPSCPFVVTAKLTCKENKRDIIVDWL